MKTPFAALVLLSTALCSLGHAAEPTEISPDLGYLRVHSIVQERGAIAAALLKTRPLVLDLRYPVDERDAGEFLRAELGSSSAKPRLYVLVSPATPVPVVGAIASSPTQLVTLGVKGARPEPEVVVQQSADDDRRAYDALASGNTLGDLISGKIDKEHYDEATLVQEFKEGNHDAHPPETAPPGPPTAPSHQSDRVLQRAVNLHSALLALKR